jgi:uncharacterized protein with von Willebrand factor type A (vWA) domain
MSPRLEPYADLSKNILLFSQALREKKVKVTTDNVLDTLKGTSFINIQRKDDFHTLLKSNLVSHRDEVALFDELFQQFWSFEERMNPSLKNRVEEKSNPSEERESPAPPELQKNAASLLKDWAEEEGEDQGKEAKEVPAYSPEEVLGRKDFGQIEAEDLGKVREFVSALSRRLALSLSRRWKQGKTGDQVDFRRTLRQSLRYGGDLVELRMKEPKPRPPRLILVCDVSGSMDMYTQFFLLFAYGLQNHYPHCETFVYSTRLSHISSFLRRKAFHETIQLLTKRVADWSGGTQIGAALHHLHHNHTDLFVSRRTVVLIFSDGWDRGDTQLLDSEMKQLKRQVKRLIWLNPLLGSPAYQPLCRGMATALPYLDHFLPCHNIASLKHLSHLLLRI